MSDDRDALRAWLELLAAAGGLKKSMDAKFRDRWSVFSETDLMQAQQQPAVA